MNDDLLDKFGELLMRHVRDESIIDWDMIIDGKMKDPSSMRLHNEIKEFNQSQIELLKRIYPQVVDTVLHHLLWTLQQKDMINVLMKDENGRTCNIRECSDGLAGELYAEDGWINRYSKERYIES